MMTPKTSNAQMMQIAPLNSSGMKQKRHQTLKSMGMAFEEAATAFDNEYAYVQEDELHSESEPREWLIGYSDQNRLLMITFFQRAHDLVRLISARLVTRGERKIYEERSRF